MTATAPLAFPGGRTLAGWWRQLTPLQPRQLWFGHLFLHRVEALVSLTRAQRLDALNHLILKALPLVDLRPRSEATAPPVSLETLDSRLHLGRQVLQRVLVALRTEGLTQSDAAGEWQLTERGQRALEQGTYPRTIQERRNFFFVERGRSHQPHFLNLKTSASVPWPASEDWVFDANLLQTCIAQPPEWKQRHGFSLEVEALVPAEPASVSHNALETWQRVILDRPERLVAVLVLTALEEGGERLVGLVVRQDGWALQAEPVFSLNADWREVFPELDREPTLEEWRQAWRMWCHPRGLSSPEIESCPLQRVEHQLRVTLGSRLLERLRASRSDALKGEAWVLAGEGPIRSAAQLEIAEAALP